MAGGTGWRAGRGVGPPWRRTALEYAGKLVENPGSMCGARFATCSSPPPTPCLLASTGILGRRNIAKMTDGRR